MSSRFILPFADVGSGIKPSSGAQLFFFATGGSTPKNTFSDQLSTPTPNANPVIANAVGVFPDIFITGTYKVVLKDKNGVQIWEADPVDELGIGALINDLSQTYDFATQQLMIDSLIVFPAGKKLTTIEHTAGTGVGGANYIKTAGATTLPAGSPNLDAGGYAQIQDRGVYDLCAYGALGTNAVVDTAAFKEAVVKVNASGTGGTFKLNSNVLLNAVDDEILGRIQNLVSFTLLANGFKFIDNKSTWVDGETWQLFKFEDITILNCNYSGVSQSSVNLANPSLNPKVGMRGIEINKGCNGGTITAEQFGGERCVYFGGRLHGTQDKIPLDERSANFTINVTTDNTHYPFRATFNGNNVTANVKATNCGRPYYLYGCDNVTVHLTGKNTFKTGLVNAFEGEGCSNVTINFKNKESDLGAPAASLSGIRWGDSTPARHTNITFNFDVESIVADSWGAAFEIGKYASGVPDSVGRGHTLAGLTVTGLLDNTACGNATVSTVGAFASPDVITGLDIEDLEIKGGTATISLATLTGGATVTNLNANGSNFRVLTNDTSTVTFLNCSAGNFTNNTSDTSKHVYIGCDITDASVQNTTDNKTFIDTEIAGVLTNTFLKAGSHTGSVSKKVDGSLGTAVSLAFIKQNQVQIELEYYTVQDRLAGTRVEAYGVVSLTASVASDGTWSTAGYQSQAQYIGQQANGTSPAITIVLTTGNATDGGLVQVSSSTYNLANTRSSFKLNVKALNADLALKEA